MSGVRFSALAVIDVDGWCHGWLVVVIETTIKGQWSGGDESVIRCCW